MILFPAIIMAIEDDSDREFMERLYIRHRRLMVSIAYSMTRNSHAAEDIVSEACAALIKKLPLLRTFNEKKLYAYVATTVRRRAFNYAKAQKKYILTDIIPDTEASGDEELDSRLIRDAEAESLRHAISFLSERDRDLLRMKYFDLLPDSEIAAYFGIKPASVRYYLTVARRALLEVLKNDEQF